MRTIASLSGTKSNIGTLQKQTIDSNTLEKRKPQPKFNPAKMQHPEIQYLSLIYIRPDSYVWFGQHHQHPPASPSTPNVRAKRTLVLNAQPCDLMPYPNENNPKMTCCLPQAFIAHNRETLNLTLSPQANTPLHPNPPPSTPSPRPKP